MKSAISIAPATAAKRHISYLPRRLKNGMYLKLYNAHCTIKFVPLQQDLGFLFVCPKAYLYNLYILLSIISIHLYTFTIKLHFVHNLSLIHI